MADDDDDDDDGLTTDVRHRRELRPSTWYTDCLTAWGLSDLRLWLNGRSRSSILIPPENLLW